MAINSSLQLAGFVMAILGLIMSIAACFDPQWKQNDRSLEVLEWQRTYEGLWKKCKEGSIGFNSCDTFDHFIIGLPTLLLAGRLFTTFGIVFFLLGNMICIVGLSCIQTSSPDGTKAKMSVVGGFLNLIAGISLGIAVSWYAAVVGYEWTNPMARGININTSAEYRTSERFVLGRSLFIGWGAMAVGVTGGILSICSSWGAMNEEDEEDRYDGYNNPKAYSVGQPSNNYV